MEKECAHCGERFVAKRNSRLYCSNNCKQLAYYKRNGLVLQGNRSQHTPLEGHGIVKDVKVSPALSESFIARLNALIEEEVQRRLAQRVSADDIVKQNGTVKPYFTESDNSLFAVHDNAGGNHNADYSHDVDVTDDIDTTAEPQESFTKPENVNSYIEPAGLSNDEEQTQYSKDTNVKDDIGTTTKSVESFTQTEDHHLEPVDFPDDDEPIDNSNDTSVKDDINTTSESIASFTESKTEIEGIDSSDCSTPKAAIYSDTQSPEALNVKHEPEASFTVTTVNDGLQDVDNDAEFEKALAALDNFPIPGIDNSKYAEEELLSSAAATNFPSQTPLDSSQPFNVKDSIIANEKKEKIAALIASLQAVARKDNFDKPVTGRSSESSQGGNLLKPEGINNKPFPQHNLPFNVKESFTTSHKTGITPVKAKDVSNVDRDKHTQEANEFKRVHSTFIRQINKHPRRADIEFLQYRNSPDQCKILITTKSLLRHLMFFTLCRQVNRHAVVQLSNGFYKMVNSEEFSSLPKSFPYQETLVQLHKQILSIAKKAKGTSISLRISRAQRARIFAILTEMKSTVKGIEFSKLTKLH
jgi:hypothetical protein